jgi:hypothetical protein
MTCLHCELVSTINAHFEAAGHMHGDAVVVDAPAVLEATSRVTAEALSAVDDDELRAKILTLFLRKVVDDVNTYRKHGIQPEILVPS